MNKMTESTSLNLEQLISETPSQKQCRRIYP